MQNYLLVCFKCILYLPIHTAKYDHTKHDIEDSKKKIIFQQFWIDLTITTL